MDELVNHRGSPQEHRVSLKQIATRGPPKGGDFIFRHSAFLRDLRVVRGCSVDRAVR